MIPGWHNRYRGWATGSNIDREKRYFSLSEHPDQLLGHTWLPIQWVPRLFPGDKAAGV